SEFEYGNLSVPASVNANETFQVSIPVTNTGTINTSEVVQLYVKNTQSAYGEYTPKKQLAAFEKVEIAPGETKTVTLTVNPKDLMIWDVNRGEFIVETGQYAVMVGSSSEDIRAEKNVMIQGSTLQTLNSNTFSVFDHSFAADEVIY